MCRPFVSFVLFRMGRGRLGVARTEMQKWNLVQDADGWTVTYKHAD